MASPDQLRRIMPDLSPEKATAWAPKLADACRRFGIDTPLREAAFLAQLAHESQDLTKVEESLSYRAERLVTVWPSRFPTLASAQPYARNPQGLANKVYAGRIGNGDEASGDGWRFRGRGPIQITGRANYAACAKGIGFDVVANPDLVLQVGVGSLTAAHFWKSNGLNELADKRDFKGITRRINTAMLGLPERQAIYARALAVLGVR